MASSDSSRLESVMHSLDGVASTAEEGGGKLHEPVGVSQGTENPRLQIRLRVCYGCRVRKCQVVVWAIDLFPLCNQNVMV